MRDTFTPPTEDELMGPEELREHFRDYYSTEFGTSDIEEGLRRLTMLEDWRDT